MQEIYWTHKLIVKWKFIMRIENPLPNKNTKWNMKVLEVWGFMLDLNAKHINVTIDFAAKSAMVLTKNLIFPITPQYHYIRLDRYIYGGVILQISVSKWSHMLFHFTAYLKQSRKRFQFWICKKGVSFRNLLHTTCKIMVERREKRRGRRSLVDVFSIPS